MSIRAVITDEIRTIALEHNKSLADLTDDFDLSESGFDSLCFAILVSRLEDITGHDPFRSVRLSRYPRSVGELITLYDDALAHEAPLGKGKQEMEIEVENDEILVSYQPGDCGAMVVAFAGGGLKVLGKHIEEFCHGLEEIGGAGRFHIINIIDKQRTWYNNNLSAYFLDYVNSLSSKLHISRVVTLGNSGGGTAAIAYARRFSRCVQAVAFCPQSSVHQAIVPFESRWPVWRSGITRWDIFDATTELDRRIRYDIFFGMNDIFDMRHAERFKHVAARSMNLHLIEGSGHNVVNYLREQGELNSILYRLIWDTMI
jgi:hypothetical protein